MIRTAAERPVETAGSLQHVQHQLGVIIPIPAPCERGGSGHTGSDLPCSFGFLRPVKEQDQVIPGQI